MRICWYLSEFFTENGTMGTLEAADYNEIDQGLPSFEESFDPCCRNSTSVPMSEFCMAYIDDVNRI